MSRDGLGQYAPPAGTQGIPNYTVESARYNTFVADITQDLNLPRPIVAGGTGASTPDGALDGLSAEKFKQVVTDWSGMVWRAGSFYAASTAIGTAPVAGHAFAGIAYYANASDFVLEATDLTDPINPTKYIRIMVSGVWGNWLLASGGSGTTGDYTFDNTTTFPPASGQIRFNNAVENSTTEIFISHLNALGVDLTGTLSASLKSGYDIFVQDKDEPTKYKIFTATAAPVVSGGDFRILVALKTAGVDIVSGQRVVTSISTGSAVVYDVAQGLTINQRAQARSNIDVLKKNYIINGAMMVSQENGATAGTTTNFYPVDMFFMAFSNAGTQTASWVGVVTPGGSGSRIRITATAADASVGAGDFCVLIQAIEGVRAGDLRSGSSAAKTITIQFGVKAPAGTYCVTLRNTPALNRAYSAEYVIAAGEANTDVVKSVVITLDQSGTWSNDTTGGIYISWCLMVGSSLQQSAGAWAAGNFLGSPNQFNFMGTINNIFELFDVSLTEGNVAPPFMVPDYASELALCMRYYESVPLDNTYAPVAGGLTVATNGSYHIYPFKVAKRALPTMTYSSAADFIVQYGASINTALTALTMPGVSTGAAQLNPAIVGTTMTVGAAVNLHRNATAPAKMAFSVRL
jgi:hypothetical protein